MKAADRVDSSEHMLQKKRVLQHILRSCVDMVVVKIDEKMLEAPVCKQVSNACRGGSQKVAPI